MHLPVGTLLQGGRYEILRYISSGGFGCTYEARDTKFKSRLKSVAIKEFFVKDFCNRDASSNRIVIGTLSKRELVDKLRKKFLDEADALFELEHPNIVRVTDTFEENGTAYYVMEYINGSTLASIIEKDGPLGEEKALGYIRQVADALRYIHSHNRLHLDVKPQNIMIDQSGKAVLIDFGVSKQYDEVSGENTSTLMGFTPGYAPIEQSGNSVGDFNAASDIYALGATLYKALTGETPLPASKRASGAKYKELHFPEGLTEATREAVDKAMQLYIDNRPQSIAEFLSMLTENGKVKTASFDNASSDKSCAVQTQFAPHGSRSASVVKTATPDSEETRLNSKNVVGAGASHTKPVSWQQTDAPVAVVSNERTKSRKSLWIILLLLLIAGGFILRGTEEQVAEEQAELERIAAEQVAEEQARLEREAEEQRAREEAERIAAEQAAAEQRAREEAERIALEKQQGISTEKKVDLGLSVYWAGWNVGASSPEGDGGYYAWGETTEKTDYTSYQYYNNGYIDIGSNISDTRYDVALAEWGSGWRMPSEKEFIELLNKCTWTWTTYKGVNGYKVTGPNGNSIFLPAAGYRNGTELRDRGSYGYYWSGTLIEGGSSLAYILHFYSGRRDLNYYYGYRDYGNSVRPVSE